jgi:hypothetical protein
LLLLLFIFQTCNIFETNLEFVHVFFFKVTANSLQYLRETIANEGGHTIAAIYLESITVKKNVVCEKTIQNVFLVNDVNVGYQWNFEAATWLSRRSSRDL